MMKNPTAHAEKRLRQRGIRCEIVNCLLKYGTLEHTVGGATKRSLKRRDADKIINGLKKEIKAIEKTKGKCVIEKEGKILTAYHQK
jgi:hypothetical protein